MANPLMSTNGDVLWRDAQVAHASGWTISLAVEGKTYATNNTNGLTNRRPGNVDATGTFNIKRSDASLPFISGQIAKLTLRVNASAGWVLVNALITSIDEEINIETNEIIGYTVNWEFAGADGGGGSITSPSGAVVNRTTVGEVSES